MSIPFFEFVDLPSHRSRPGLYAAFGKRVLDVALILLMAPVVVPVMAVILLVTMVQGGRPLYVQERLGRDGRRFRCWKVRTMVHDVDAELRRILDRDPGLAAEWAAHQKLSRDPRITRFGHILRRSSLDELPQLWNVLRGDMSLVGPRPFLPEQAPLYAGGNRDAAYFRLRPGLTGLWQVSRRNAGTFAERAEYDAEYGRDVSLMRDLAILARTVGVVLRATGR